MTPDKRDKSAAVFRDYIDNFHLEVQFLLQLAFERVSNPWSVSPVLVTE